MLKLSPKKKKSCTPFADFWRIHSAATRELAWSAPWLQSTSMCKIVAIQAQGWLNHLFIHQGTDAVHTGLCLPRQEDCATRTEEWGRCDIEKWKLTLTNDQVVLLLQILDDRAHLVKLQKIINEKEDIIKQLKQQARTLYKIPYLCT